MSAILDHTDGSLAFPLAGRARDDVRSSMRTTAFKKETLIAYEVDESFGEPVLNVLRRLPRGPGLGGGGQRTPRRSRDGLMTHSCVANVWQDDQPPPTMINSSQRFCAGQPHIATKDQRPPVSVPRFPWYS